MTKHASEWNEDTWEKELKEDLETGLQVLRERLASIRTGRVSVDVLDDVVVVMSDGQHHPLKAVSLASVVDNRTLSLQVWDAKVVTTVEKALRASPFGQSIGIVTEGQRIRVSFPETTREARLKLEKVVHEHAHTAKESVRHVRQKKREALEKVKKKYSEDMIKVWHKNIEKHVESFTSEIQKALEKKIKDMEA